MSIDRLDVPAAQVASDMAALIARQRQQLAVDKLRWLLAEQDHVTHDSDPVDRTFQQAAVTDNWGPVNLIKNRPGRAT